MKDMKKKAKMMLLKDLSKEMRGMMGDGYAEGMKKVTVASDSDEGLEEGLKKAGEIVEDSDEMIDEDSDEMIDEDSDEMIDEDSIEAFSDDDSSEEYMDEEEYEEEPEMDKNSILKKIRMLQEQLENM